MPSKSHAAQAAASPGRVASNDFQETYAPFLNIRAARNTGEKRVNMTRRRPLMGHIGAIRGA
jgi:hypothetical protein